MYFSVDVMKYASVSFKNYAYIIIGTLPQAVFSPLVFLSNDVLYLALTEWLSTKSCA